MSIFIFIFFHGKEDTKKNIGNGPSRSSKDQASFFLPKKKKDHASFIKSMHALGTDYSGLSKVI